MQSPKLKIVLAVIITVLIVGGGVYYWQQNKIMSIQGIEKTKNKSVDGYLSIYEKSPATITFSDNKINQLVKVFSLGLEKCTSLEVSEFCTPESVQKGLYISSISLLSDADWNDGKSHEFYFEFDGEGPPLYYGPFQDNVTRLAQEASRKENFDTR